MEIIRKLEPSDVPAIAQMAEMCFSMPWKEKDFEGLIEDPNSLYLVAEEDGVLTGGCGVTNILGEGDINNVMVHPEHRGCGIAKRLLKETLLQGKDLGIEEYTLEVRVGNASAIHIYEQAGFVSEGIRPRFYERPVEDAMIMWIRKA